MKDFKSKAAAYLRKHAVKGRLRSGISILSCIVVFTSTYALVLPALTLESRAACGMEEHQHTEECYDDVLICGQEESEGHTHTEECYNDAGELTCGQEESEGHTHTEDCYEKQLTCGKEVHIHTEACYPDKEEEQADSDSTKEQSDDAKVSDSGQNDSDNDGQDAASAENKEQSQTDQEPSGQGAAEQTASEQTPSTQEDGKQEDMPAGAADPESLDRIKFVDYLTDETTVLYVPEDGDKWQPIHKDDEVDPEEDVKLTPDQKILLHIGYELPAGTINETNAETEYTLPLLMNLSDDEVEENNEKYYNMIEGTDREADNLKSAGRYEIREKKNDDGEVIERKLVLTCASDACKKNGGEKLTDGTETLAAQKLEGFFEILISAQDLVDPEAETALEKERINLDPIQLEDGQSKENYLYSYLIEWNEDKEELDTEVFYDGPALDAWLADQKGEKEEDSVFAAGTLEFEGEDYKVAATFDESAQLPDGVTLQVSELKGEEYDAYLEQAQSALGEEKTVAGARFFDITFVNADGEPVEPKGMVDVRIEYERAETIEDSANVEGLHFTEEGAQAIEMENNGQTPGENGEPALDSVSFSSDSFSVYGVVYTVDFHWEVDGKEYEFNIPGGGFVSLQKLVEILGIAENDAEGDSANDTAEEQRVENAQNRTALTLNHVQVSEKTKEFVADVEKVVFSSPKLVWVGAVEEDTSVGKLKEEKGLEYEYSAELTEEQIDEINAQTVKAGDWALISMHPFLSEESLIVTMKDGEVFTIKVTDAQDPYGLDGQSFEIVWNGNTALSPVLDDVVSGHTYLNDANVGSGSSLAWKFEYDENAFGEGHGGYYISHAGEYIKMVGTGPNDAGANITLEASKANATPIAVHYDKNTGKYSFSNTADASTGFLCHMTANWNNGYFGISETATTNAWMELKNPDNPNLPGLVSPWDIKSDNITLKLFDYSGKVGNNQDIDSQWGTSYTAAQWRTGSGVNNDRTFLFTGGGRNDEGDPYNYYTGSDPAVMQGIVKDHLENGYPVLTKSVTSKGASLGYLFGAGGQDGVTEYSGGGSGLKGLLRKDENGYYYYSSEQNFAKLNDAKDEILVYSESYKKDKPSVNAEHIGFFPFDTYKAGQSKAGEEKGPNGSPYNHQFGMTLEANFILPPGGKLPNGDDMKFTFSGDDDVWVFIDDVLVLDLGGVHQPLTGTINFAGDGLSEVVDASVQSVSGQSTIGKQKTLTDIFEEAGEEYDDSSYSQHTIKFFYLERGGCDSNCTLSFNLLMYKTLTVAKELEGLTDEERAKYANDEFICDLFVNGEPYNGRDTIRYDAAGNAIEEGFLVTNGKVTLKPGERVRVIGLKPTDTFYAAEENGISMTEFYPPRAERFYQDDDKVSHEEEVQLSEEHEGQSADISDWRTKTYPVENLEELMFTNTLREKNLDIEKKWSDGTDKHSNDEVKFKIAAKVLVDGNKYDYQDVISAIYSDKNEQNKKISDVLNTTYTLSAANDWKAQIEHLPSVNTLHQEIEYVVIEIQTANGYGSSVTLTDSHNIDVVKIFPEDHTFSDEEIQFKLRKGTEGNYQYYNADNKTWGNESSATVHTLNSSNNYSWRFHDMPGAEEEPAGEYSYIEIGDNQGSDNPKTDGLVVYDRKLIKTDIVNSPFSINVKKEWDPEELANENVEGRKVDVTIGRYILMNKEGNLRIIKEGIPEGATFKATYEVKNTDTGTVYGVYPYVREGISVKVPEGNYTVTETILEDDNTYYPVHDENRIQTVEVKDGGDVAEVIYTATYTPRTGQLRIKSTLEANDTGVSYDNVKYEVYDQSGACIKTVTFQEASAETGYSVNVKWGQYTVKEVGAPATPQNVKARLKPKAPADGSGREVSAVVLNEKTPGIAEFSAKYTKEVVDTSATVHVTSTFSTPVEKSKGGFHVGDVIRITYKRNNSEKINVQSVTGGTIVSGPVQDEAPGGNNSWNATHHVDIKITAQDVNAEFNTTGYDYNGQYGLTSLTNDNVQITLVSSGNRSNSPVNSLSKFSPRLASKQASNEGGTSYKNIDITETGSAPDNPEGKKYVEDSSFSRTVTLNYGHWSEVLSDLPTTDASGNKYYYYIKSVHEENMPSTTKSTIKFGEEGKAFLIGGDLNSGEDFEVTNTVVGSLSITKNVTVDGNPTDTDWADGTYYFTILDAKGSPAKGKVNGSPIGEDGKVSITITNGVSNTVVVTDIPVGDYTITEDEPNNGTTLTKIDDVVVTSSTVNVTIADDSAAKSFTNNRKLSDMEETTDLSIEKKWYDDSGEMSADDVADKKIKYKLTQFRAEVPYDSDEAIFPVVIRMLDASGNLIQIKTYYVKKGVQPTLRINKADEERDRIKIHLESQSGRYQTNYYSYPDNFYDYKEYVYLMPRIIAETQVTIQAEKERTDLTKFSIDNKYIADDPKSYIEALSEHFTFSEKSSAEVLLDAEEKNVNFVLDGITYSASNKGWKAAIDQLPFYNVKDGKFYVYKEEVTDVEVDGQPVIVKQDGTSSAGYYSVEYDRTTDGVTLIKNTLQKIDIDILKVEKDHHEKALENVRFKLRRTVENPDTIGNDIQYAEDETKAIETDPTDENGKTGLKGIGSGYYEVKESVLPNGYVIIGDGAFYIRVSTAGVELLQKDLTKKPKDWTVIQKGGMVYSVSQAEGTTPASIMVENEPGTALPNTGGPGTGMLYLMGIMMAAFAGAGLVMGRRRRGR